MVDLIPITALLLQAADFMGLSLPREAGATADQKPATQSTSGPSADAAFQEDFAEFSGLMSQWSKRRRDPSFDSIEKQDLKVRTASKALTILRQVGPSAFASPDAYEQLTSYFERIATS